MKRNFYFLILLLLVVGACQKEHELQDADLDLAAKVNYANTPDQIHEVLAKVLSLSLADRNVRVFLHAEIGKQFTYDYDILYDLIKNKEIESEKYGLIKFSDLLRKVADEANVDFSMFDESLFQYKNLQISSPVYYKDWDASNFSPLVISLPEKYNEGMQMQVKAFDKGNQCWVLEDEIAAPILLVRMAERVDANGMMRVDPDGFVISEDERVVTAGEAYAYADQHLKSASAEEAETVTQVLEDANFQNVLISRRALYSEDKMNPVNITGTTAGQGLKSATATTLAAPANFTVHPAGPNTIQINWSQVAGAVSYEIFRQYLTYSNSQIATVNGEQINYFDQYLNIGAHYTYSVRAVDDLGNRSVLTDGKESYASWRTNGRRDVIDKIYISSECWNWCAGLFDGKIELQYKTSYLLTPANTNMAYPSTGVNSLGQKTKDQQKGKWCYYNHYLFPWDVRCNSYSYRFKLIEDDGAGDGTKIKLGITFKVQFFKIIDFSAGPGIEFTIADKDEDFGEVIILYWEPKSGPIVNGVPSDGYNLVPDKGSARMYLKQ